MSRPERHPGSTHRKDRERQRKSGSPCHTVEKTGKRENGKAGSKNGGSHENSVNSARREARFRQRRKKKILRNVTLVLLVLLIAAVVAGVGFLIKNGSKKASGSDKNNTENVVTDASDQNDTSADGTDAEGNSSDEEDADASGEQTDNRKVKNTATEEHHKTNGLAICMYHYVYDEADPPEDLNNNFIEVHALEEEVKYLVDNEYYFPTWEEVKQYVEGNLLLPEKEK